jgi:hypothetical protein
VSVDLRAEHLGVAEISFFALDYKFTTKVISHVRHFDIPLFDNIKCDGTQSGWNAG